MERDGDPRRAIIARRSLAINSTTASVVARRAGSAAEWLNTTPASGWRHRGNPVRLCFFLIKLGGLHVPLNIRFLINLVAYGAKTWPLANQVKTS